MPSGANPGRKVAVVKIATNHKILRLLVIAFFDINY